MEPLPDNAGKKRSIDLDTSLRAFDEKAKRFKSQQTSPPKKSSFFGDLSPPRRRPSRLSDERMPLSTEKETRPRTLDDLGAKTGKQSAYNDLKAAKQYKKQKRDAINAESALILMNGEEIPHNRKIYNGLRVALPGDELHPSGFWVTCNRHTDTLLNDLLTRARHMCQIQLYHSRESILQSVRLLAYLVRDASISQELCIHDDETVLSASVRESRIDAKSLLFKYLADRVGISSSLVFLPSCRTRAALNFVHLPNDSGRILVDLVRPSTLFDSVKNSDLISKYMDSPIVIEDKLIQSCFEGENRRNDSLKSGLEILCDLSVSHVSIGDQIGSGQFAKVHRGKIGPFPCACKVINTSEMPVAQLNQLFEREIPMLRLCQNHPSILQLIGVYRRPGSIVILSELCSSSLYDLIQTLKKERNPLDGGPPPGFSLEDVIFVARSLISALSHLSNHNIAHRDLKSHNILLNVRPPSEAASTVGSRGTASMILECKLADFGLAKQIKQGKQSLRKSVGSRRWMAPEVQSGETPYNTTCDIWSLGLILVEMITLDLPFPSLNALDIKAAVLGGSAVCYDPDSMLRHRPDLGPVIDIIQQCLIADPASRPTAPHLLQSPIFSQDNTE